jgi:hypothetical protein
VKLDEMLTIFVNAGTNGGTRHDTYSDLCSGRQTRWLRYGSAVSRRPSSKLRQQLAPPFSAFLTEVELELAAFRNSTPLVPSLRIRLDNPAWGRHVWRGT